MSTIDLVILGFTKKSPINAYDLAKIIERTSMTRWLKIGLPTIYQNLKKLAEKRYLSVQSLSNGNMPEKTMYSITPEGERHWLELMERYSSDPGYIYFDFNAFIVNAALLDPKARSKMLENLRAHFLKQREDLRQAILNESNAYPVEGRTIMEQYARTYDALIAWVESYIAEQTKAIREAV